MWITILCQALGITETHQNRLILSLWAVSEGVDVHLNNPLGCTRVEIGSHAATGVGVQAYPDLGFGMAATARELSTTPYASVLEALEGPESLEGAWIAINESPWRRGAQQGFYPLELWHAWQTVPETGPETGEVDLD